MKLDRSTRNEYTVTFAVPTIELALKLHGYHPKTTANGGAGHHLLGIVRGRTVITHLHLDAAREALLRSRPNPQLLPSSRPLDTPSVSLNPSTIFCKTHHDQIQTHATNTAECFDVDDLSPSTTLVDLPPVGFLDDGKPSKAFSLTPISREAAFEYVEAWQRSMGGATCGANTQHAFQRMSSDEIFSRVDETTVTQLNLIEKWAKGAVAAAEVVGGLGVDKDELEVARFVLRRPDLEALDGLRQTG